MNSYINLILDAEGAKARLRKLFESAPEPEIARESIPRKSGSNVQLRHGLAWLLRIISKQSRVAALLTR
jgi:hypothetical protein